jgi:hypothetical protein
MIDDAKLIALNDSIQHWTRNLALVSAGNDPEIGDEHCACCKIANEECIGCPIHEITTIPHCNSTPYKKVIQWWSHAPTEHSRKELIRAVSDMLDYLYLIEAMCVTLRY